MLSRILLALFMVAHFGSSCRIFADIPNTRIEQLGTADSVDNILLYAESERALSNMRIVENVASGKNSATKGTIHTLDTFLQPNRTLTGISNPLRFVLVPLSDGDLPDQELFNAFSKDPSVQRFMQQLLRAGVSIEIPGGKRISERDLPELGSLLTSGSVGTERLKRMPAFISQLSMSLLDQKLATGRSVAQPVVVYLWTGDSINMEGPADIRSSTSVFVDIRKASPPEFLRAKPEEWLRHNFIPYVRVKAGEDRRPDYGAMLSEAEMSLGMDLKMRAIVRVQSGLLNPLKRNHELRVNLGGSVWPIPIEFSSGALRQLSKRNLAVFKSEINSGSYEYAVNRLFPLIVGEDFSEEAINYFYDEIRRKVDAEASQSNFSGAAGYIEQFKKLMPYASPQIQKLGTLLVELQYRELYEKTIQQVEQGEYATALTNANKLLRSNPSDEQLLGIVGKSSFHLGYEKLKAGQAIEADQFLVTWRGSPAFEVAPLSEVIKDILQAGSSDPNLDSVVYRWLGELYSINSPVAGIQVPLGSWILSVEDLQSRLKRLGLVPNTSDGIKSIAAYAQESRSEAAISFLDELRFIVGDFKEELKRMTSQDRLQLDVRDYVLLNRANAMATLASLIADIGKKGASVDDVMQSLGAVSAQAINRRWAQSVSFSKTSGVSWIPKEFVDRMLAGGQSYFVNWESRNDQQLEVVVFVGSSEAISLKVKTAFGMPESAIYRNAQQVDIAAMVSEPHVLGYLCFASEVFAKAPQVSILERAMKKMRSSLPKGSYQNMLILEISLDDQSKPQAVLLKDPSDLPEEYVNEMKFNLAPIPYLLKDKYAYIGVPVATGDRTRYVLRIAMKNPQ